MRRIAPFAVLAGVFAAAGIALAQTPNGIVRPTIPKTAPLVEQGSQLYAANCSGCHGIDGRGVLTPGAQIAPGGVKGQGPPLQGVGAIAPDFYLRTGYMPLNNPEKQPYDTRVQFSDHEIRAIVAYVASLGKGPAIPHPHPDQGNVAAGLELFTEHCAGCHQVAAEGGYVTDARVPLLKEQVTPTKIAEAVRIGPYYMPKFAKKDINDRQLNSIIAYVRASVNPADRGGWGIGHIGPVPEGIVTWLLAAVVLVVTCMVIGRRMSS